MSSVRVIEGDCLAVLPTLEAGSVDAVVTDPPYGLAFMGKDWDYGVPGAAFWAAALRVLKPGGYALVFGGTRTYHRLACAVEDAGFEVRDCLMWLYGQGFPKGKGCLKPAWEPILLCRRPGPKVLPLRIDEARVGADELTYRTTSYRDCATGEFSGQGQTNYTTGHKTVSGRWPANVAHDGSDEVLEAFAAFGEKTSGSRKAGVYQPLGMYANAIGERPPGLERPMPELVGDTGTAARFFYCAKASKAERAGGNHPTVKPVAIMRWLVRLVCPPGGTVLDPFAGSGTTGLAARAEGRSAILIEREPAYCEIIRRRLAEEQGPLFGGEMRA